MFLNAECSIGQQSRLSNYLSTFNWFIKWAYSRKFGIGKESSFVERPFWITNCNHWAFPVWEVFTDILYLRAASWPLTEFFTIKVIILSQRYDVCDKILKSAIYLFLKSPFSCFWKQFPLRLFLVFLEGWWFLTPGVTQEMHVASKVTYNFLD